MNIEGFMLCPPHFSYNAMRVDTPAKNMQGAYESDVEFFKRNRGRRLRLKTASMREFDLCAQTPGEFARLPTLHVLVIQMSAGHHLVVPVYRGRAFFKIPDSDIETISLIGEFYNRGGIDHVAELQCAELQKVQSKLNAPITSEVIH